MQLVFIHGPAACGKLTVATELAALTGLRLFHNHLTVDLAASLFDFGSEPFKRLRESIWLESFREAAEHGQSLVFTFHPESTVDPGFPERAESAIRRYGGEVVFVELTCSESEIERRVESQSRARYGKLQSLTRYRALRDSGAFAFPPLPAPALRIDTSVTPPRDAARQIADLLGADAAPSVEPGAP